MLHNAHSLAGNNNNNLRDLVHAWASRERENRHSNKLVLSRSPENGKIEKYLGVLSRGGMELSWISEPRVETLLFALCAAWSVYDVGANSGRSRFVLGEKRDLVAGLAWQFQ